MKVSRRRSRGPSLVPLSSPMREISVVHSASRVTVQLESNGYVRRSPLLLSVGPPPTDVPIAREIIAWTVVQWTTANLGVHARWITRNFCKGGNVACYSPWDLALGFHVPFYGPESAPMKKKKKKTLEDKFLLMFRNCRKLHKET